MLNSYGRVRHIGRIRQPYAFTGREYDKETGLYYYRARYYDPEIGRFISKDPFPGFLSYPQTLNLYPYVGNNPVNRVDPWGLWWRFSFGVGGTLGVVDINWNTINPTQTNVSIVTPQIGGGFNICFNKDRRKSKCRESEAPLEEQPLMYTVGSRYLGISFTDNYGSFCINLGLSIGPLPINIGLPLFSTDYE